ncbi:MAG: glycosyltransferase [Flavobacteriia bacterium]|nr:glycosyltransferase [Flavobacteriia bacterium]
MKASITILSFNRRLYLEKTLEALLDSLTDRHEVEIILVDNGSEDDSPQLIREWLQQGIIDNALLFGTNQGISKGFNSGFALSHPQAKFLIKLDCDIVIHHRGWLEEMEQIFEDHHQIGLLMLFQENHPTMKDCARTQLGQRTFISLNEIIVGSACFTIPRKTIDAIGYFFEDHDYLLFYDDIDYYIRLEMIGKEAYYLLSHTSSYQEHLDASFYEEYDKSKDPLYARMNVFHKQLNSLYREGVFPTKRFYARMEELAKIALNHALIELP